MASMAFLDNGTRKLAFNDEGSRGPTVVLEMGLGAAGDFYDDVARQIATFTRVIWYDRPGLGGSDPAPTPRTIRDIVLDLHALLRTANIPGPYVLVGHSMGGLTVRYYRELYPEEVAAIVLIDSTHEAQRERLLAILPSEQADELESIAQFRIGLSERWADPQQNEEKIDNLANSELMRNCHALGGTPLIVVSRGRSSYTGRGLPAEIAERMEQEWQQMQRELVQLSTQGRQIIASNSGHLVNKDEPELIVDAVRQVVGQIRIPRN